MPLDFAIRQATAQDSPRQSPGAAGADRVAGSAPPTPSPELGPPNPRLRMDQELGMVVIEFRDASGQVAVSLPTPRELEAYRAAMMYGSSLPSDMAPNNDSVEALIKSGPALPPINSLPPGPLAQFLKAGAAKESVDRVT